MGRLPVYVIVDTEMVKQITVKKFDHFVDRFPVSDYSYMLLWNHN